MHRRTLITAAAAALAPVSWTVAHAQAAWPSKPLRLIVGYTAGGAVDIIARAVGQQLQAALGQPVIVDNKPGAGTNLALRALIDSAPDGYTLMLTANAIAANVTLYQPPPYELPRDVTPIAPVGRVPVVIAVNAASPHDTLARLVAAAKARPDTVTYASPGNGSTPHLAVELFERTAGVSLTHVPYKGGAQAITDVIGGHVQALAVNALEVLPHVKSGKLRVLAVLTPRRAAILPEVPTAGESGWPGFEASVWYGLIGPARLPAAIVERLNAEVQRALATDEVKGRLTSAGGEVTPGPAPAFAELLASERARYEKLIREARIQPD